MLRSLIKFGSCAILLAAMTVNANAQSFTEDFDAPTLGASTTLGNTVGGDPVVLSSGTWHALNVSPGGAGSTGWFNNITVFPALTGAGQLNANFNSSTGSNSIDSYFMSPVRTFNNGDTISFFTRTVTTVSFPDRLRLAFSSSGASTSNTDFGTTLLTVNPTLTTTGYPSIYTQFSVVLSGLGGPTSGRFAFNYNPINAGPAGANSDFIGIDSVAYTVVAIPEPTSALALVGLCVGGLFRRRRA